MLRQLLHTKVAPADPTTYFSIIDLLCRSEPDLNTVRLVALVLLPVQGLLEDGKAVQRGGSSLDQQQQQQHMLARWEQYKAMPSAIASFVKAYEVVLPEVSAAAAEGQVEDAKELISCCSCLVNWVTQGVVPNGAGPSGMGHTPAEDACQGASKHVVSYSAHQGLVLWLSRLVVALGQQLLGKTPAAPINGSSSSSMIGHISTVSSCSSSSSPPISSSITEGGPGSTDPLPPVIVHLQQLVLSVAIQLWSHVDVCFAGGSDSSSCTGVPTAAAASGGGGGGSSSSGTEPSVSAGPQPALPDVVSKQPQYIKQQWQLQDSEGPNQPCSQLLEVPADASDQQELLADLLHGFEQLLQEVPLPFGCSNLGCRNLAGLSEVAAASKGCSWCRQVRYCSTECQMAHLEQHRGLCRRLRGCTRQDGQSEGGVKTGQQQQEDEEEKQRKQQQQEDEEEAERKQEQESIQQREEELKQDQEEWQQHHQQQQQQHELWEKDQGDEEPEKEGKQGKGQRTQQEQRKLQPPLLQQQQQLPEQEAELKQHQKDQGEGTQGEGEEEGIHKQQQQLADRKDEQEEDGEEQQRQDRHDGPKGLQGGQQQLIGRARVPHVCFNPSCGKTGPDLALRKCARCSAVRYCSRQCQTEHWKSTRPAADEEHRYLHWEVLISPNSSSSRNASGGGIATRYH